MDGASTLRRVPVSQIRENTTALRKVDRSSEEYLNLLDSVRKNGVLQTISVVERTDPQTQTTFYLLIDGLHRLTCAKDAGLPELDVKIEPPTTSDEDILYKQIITNMHRIETKPVQYADQLRRILGKNPTMTMTELAAKVSRAPAYVNERLGLLKLEKNIGEMVDAGKIELTKAFVLAKLDLEDQKAYLDRALTLPANEFVPMVKQRISEVAKAKRAGKDAAPTEWKPTAHIRKTTDLVTEIEKPAIVKELTKGITSVEEAFLMGLKFAVHLDPISIENARQKEESRKANAAAAAEKKKKEAEEKKAKEAAEKAASII